MITLNRNERVVAVVPEIINGAGFRNSPLWVYIVDHIAGTYREECLQPEEQNDRMRVLFSTLEQAHTTMKALVLVNSIVREGIQPHGY
jgi:hypothetical protein